jgi:transportin-1
MIPFNPVGIAESFPYFCEALVEFKNPTSELEYIFKNLIQTYKVCLGEATWTAYLDSFPMSLREELNSRFNLSSNMSGTPLTTNGESIIDTSNYDQSSQQE